MENCVLLPVVLMYFRPVHKSLKSVAQCTWWVCTVVPCVCKGKCGTIVTKICSFFHFQTPPSTFGESEMYEFKYQYSSRGFCQRPDHPPLIYGTRT